MRELDSEDGPFIYKTVHISVEVAMPWYFKTPKLVHEEFEQECPEQEE